ncbi:hypothetical protein QYE76_055767 [Lolium multiflorum]|uniref:CCHC-type domain-containing protein n=1 Tax=Lolium multiflorum TaxID=4521 RepID=A0AAD8T203_LOLMU|nr:hypothetical protein QYE76_055767 [Lolium multiflorum]
MGLATAVSGSASNELWRIIVEGFKPYNPDKLTRREAVDSQLNNTALHMIQTSVGTKDLSRVRNFTTAKEAWDGLAASCIGSDSMRRNKYNALRNKAEGFMRLPDEDHEAMYGRLLTVADAFRNVGATHNNDSWSKDKYIDCMMSFEPIDVKTLVGRECFPSLTSQQAVHEMQALKVLEQNSHDSRNRALGMTRGTNLALTVNSVEEENPQEPYRTSWSMSYPDDLEFHYNDHMAFHAKTFWVDPSKAKEDNIKRNNSSGFKGSGPKTRSCYNCGDKRHFIAQCPYEHREINGGRLVPKDKSKDSKGKDSKAPNKKFYNKGKKDKRPSRIVLMTKEEYSSDEVESSSDEEETSKEVAAIATTNIPSSSLFESPNENPHIKNAHCFMARSSLDTSIVLSTQEEYTSGDDDDDEEDETSNGLVALASLSTNSSSPNGFPNEDIHLKEESCLMAKSSYHELAKASSPQSKLSLDDLLSKQRSNNGKEGLGYGAKAKKANKKKTKPAQKKVITNDVAPKANTINDDNAGIANPHYDYAAGGSKWVLDSGCTSHMTGGKNLVKELRPNINHITVSFGDNSTSEVLGFGKVVVAHNITLVDVMLVKTLGYNLLSVSALGKMGFAVFIDNDIVVLLWSKTLKVAFVGFEMSMMGEMKFFLGFEIKQLREETFINQAKNLQDMLKRFKMTEMKGVATPMVTKCHLALDPNGGSKKRGKGHVDEIEEEFEQTRPSKLTARQQSAQRHKSPAVRGKNIHVSVKNMQYLEYKELRDMNPYLTPRNNRVGDKRFHNKTQEEIFYEVYVPFKKGVAPQHAIDTAKMAATSYFKESYAMCGEFGLYPIMELNKDYDIGLIQQFYATVHFDQDEARTFRWMTHETLLESNLAKFGNALGYPRFPGVDENGWRCHDSSFAQTKEVLEHLYIKGWGIPGKSADLLPTWDIMLRVYRETIGPKGGNLDELHLYEVDLMANSFAKKGTGERLDVMDYIYNEMWSCVMEKKLPSFAPYIMKLIEDTWVDTCQTTLLHSIPLNITSHEVKVLRVKRHNSPIEDVTPMDEKPPSWASKLARRMRQIFCLTSAVNHRQYQQHVEAKKSKGRQKSIMRALNVDVSPPGSEESITPEAEWVSQHGIPLPPDGLEIESPPHTPPYPDASSNLPPGWANADPWDV